MFTSSLVRVDDAEGTTLALLRNTADPTVTGAADITARGNRLAGLRQLHRRHTVARSSAAWRRAIWSPSRSPRTNASRRSPSGSRRKTPSPASVSWTWAGDQEEQAESQAFLSQAFGAALGLMFIILLAQFNSVYNAVLVLLAVILSTAGVLIRHAGDGPDLFRSS